MNRLARRLACLVVLAPLPFVASAEPDLAAETAQARATAGRLVSQLGAALEKEMTAGGPVGAIGVCRQSAPEIAGNLSRETGSRVTRVSLRTRNPMIGTPDAWEQAALAEFDRKAAAGEKPETLERAEIVDEPSGRVFRFLKAIPVKPVCLACHGTPETIAPAVREKLLENYPHDKAVGYGIGQVRGAVSIKKPL